MSFSAVMLLNSFFTRALWASSVMLRPLTATPMRK